MESRTHLKLLSFDGGGIRGLSQLEIVNNIMHRLNWERQSSHLESMIPGDHFDLIGGSGTGGLLAIMLAKLRMTVEEASEEFCTIIEEVYKQVDLIPKERTQRLRQRMEAIMSRKGLPVAMKLLDETQAKGCACFVMASPRISAATKICLRSYAVSTHPASAVTVIEAVLATCATQPSFAPITFGLGYRKKEYIGAGLGANNPILDVISEAHSLFGGGSTVASLLSVGTGHPGIVALTSDNGGDGLYQVMWEIMNDCTQRAREIEQWIGRTGLYFRFSVEQGMQKVHTSEVLDLAWIVTQTENYLEEQGDKLERLTKNTNAPITAVTLGQLKSGDVPTMDTQIPTNADMTKLIDISGTSHEDSILAKLKPVDLECGSPVAECMEGTRQDIISSILTWASDFNAPNIFWLKGHPGVGKSAIAASLVERLRVSKRLGSKFFFQREKANVMTPNFLWRIVTYDLARQYPSIRTRLLATLKDNEDILTTVQVDNLFRQLVHEPLIASEEMPAEYLPVIVLDALDECGGLEGQYSDHRVNLIRTLKSWSSLPRSFKLVVTSRGETDIEQLFSTIDHQHLEIGAGTTVNSNSSADVRKFFEHRFHQIAARYDGALPPDWPGHKTITSLTNKAGGIFIYAETITRFVNRGQPKEQLRRILAGTGAGGMARLYSWILNASFPEPSEEVIEGFQSIVGTIILAKEPLPTSSLAHLRSIDPATVKYIVNGLQSVMESGNVPRFKHQSFVDFLIDQKECPPLFLIDVQHQKRNLTLACLQVMKRHLRFNICDLKSSYYRNNDIPDLALWVEERIPPFISHSCIFWARYLKEVAFDAEILEQIEYFMQNLFLFWLEVLSLIKRVNLGSNIMILLIDWLRAFRQDDTVATDMKRFVNAFGNVISQSAPHIYLSALPFSPLNSVVSKQHTGRYPQTITIRTGGQKEWPAIQNVLNGHESEVNTVAFSRDGRRIVSGSNDQTIRVWDAETGEEVAGPFRGHTGGVYSVAYSLDGKHIVSCSYDQTILVWDAMTGRRVAGPFKGHTDWISSVAFSPDGRHIVSGSFDKTIRVWDAEVGGEVVRPFNGHNNAVSSVAFSPDGKYIVSGSYDYMIRVWDAETGNGVAGPFEGHSKAVQSVTFSPDGKRIVSGSNDRTIRLWDAETGDEVIGPFRGHAGGVYSVAYSLDGKHIVSGSHDQKILVWDAMTGRRVAGPFKGHTKAVYSVVFSPDGRRIASGSEDQTIRVWDAEISEEDVGLFEGHNEAIICVKFSPDGRHIATGSYDHTIWVWNAQTGESISGPFEGHSEAIQSVGFSPNGRKLVSGSSDQTIWVWETWTGRRIAGPFTGHTDWVVSVAFSPDGRRIVSGSYDRTIRVWNAETGEEVAGPFISYIKTAGHNIHSQDYGDTMAATSVAFSSDGRHIVARSSTRSTQAWNVETGEGVASKSHTKAATSPAFSPDGRCIVSESNGRMIRVCKAETGKVVAGPFGGHSDVVHSVGFSPNGRYILSASLNQIRLWDTTRSVRNDLLFTDSSELVDGWILGPNSELLLWVPPKLRTGLWRPGNTVVIGGVGTRLDLGRFVHGEAWVHCKDLP